jgi:hypothetical protein
VVAHPFVRDLRELAELAEIENGVLLRGETQAVAEHQREHDDVHHQERKDEGDHG